MGKKGKGRQSGGFSSKSLRANHHQEVSRLRDEAVKWSRRETAGFVAWSNAHQKQQRRLRGERPRFALALRRNLNGILDERRALRAHNFRERRRRNGFLPQITGLDHAHENNVSNGRSHPSGWLLRYNNDDDDDNESNPIGHMAENQGVSASHEHTTGSLPRLQDIALGVFAHYIREYRSAMGDEELYGALSILPPESITELSIILSSGPTVDSDIGTNTEEGIEGGQRDGRRKRNHRKSERESHCDPQFMYMDDDLTILLGQHQHVERLCFRSTPSATSLRGTLTNAGLEALIPRTPVLSQGRHRRWRTEEAKDVDKNQAYNTDKKEIETDVNSCSSSEDVPDCWDNSEDDDGSDIDGTDELLGFGEDGFVGHETPFGRGRGCNLRLRRLELLDLSCTADNTMDVDDNGNATTTTILLRWFETCSGITHLSLAGSFQVHHEVGRTVLMSLPQLLPDLEVLDVTRCPWATDSLLARLLSGYLNNRCSGSIGNRSATDNDGDSDGAVDNHGKEWSLKHLLPTVYYHRGRFELLSEVGEKSVETDLWGDENSFE